MSNGNDFVVAQTKDSDGMWCQPKGGLTKREYFAGLAMQGLMFGSSGWPNESDAMQIGKRAIAVADALLDALAKERT